MRITSCAIYTTKTAVRAEDKIEKLILTGLGYGTGVEERIAFHNGKATAGYQNTGEHEAPPMESLLRDGFPTR